MTHATARTISDRRPIPGPARPARPHRAERRLVWVRIGSTGAARGEVVWQDGDVACIRSFSRLVVGRMIGD